MKKLNIHIIQHVFFEGPGIIADWAYEKGHRISYTHIYHMEQLPSVHSIDMLIIMGGPMSVYDTEEFNWIEQEKHFIRACIEKEKPVLGICLGAQFIASALGAKVYPGSEKEIGWFPVQFYTSFHNIFPNQQTVFHWHGDTFDIPAGAIHLSSSKAVRNQGFIYNNNVIALQFHLEVNKKSVNTLIDNCRDDLTDDPFVQSEEQILSENLYYSSNTLIMEKILSFLSDRIN